MINEKEIKKNVGTTQGANVLIRGHKCYRCKHEWRPRDLEDLPEVCPSCKSPYWYKPRKNKKNGEK